MGLVFRPVGTIPLSGAKRTQELLAESLNVRRENRVRICKLTAWGGIESGPAGGIQGAGLLAMTIPRRHLLGQSVRVLASGLAHVFSKPDADTGTRNGEIRRVGLLE